jgi:hypothetical protein
MSAGDRSSMCGPVDRSRWPGTPVPREATGPNAFAAKLLSFHRKIVDRPAGTGRPGNLYIGAPQRPVT